MSYHEVDFVIRSPVPCPVCGHEIDRFESTSGFRRFLHVSEEQLYEDYKRNFEGGPEPEDGCWYYGECENCRLTQHRNIRVVYDWDGEKFTRYHTEKGEDYIELQY